MSCTKVSLLSKMSGMEVKRRTVQVEVFWASSATMRCYIDVEVPTVHHLGRLGHHGCSLRRTSRAGRQGKRSISCGCPAHGRPMTGDVCQVGALIRDPCGHHILVLSRSPHSSSSRKQTAILVLALDRSGEEMIPVIFKCIGIWYGGSVFLEVPASI
jgi:hypothetical protein